MEGQPACHGAGDESLRRCAVGEPRIAQETADSAARNARKLATAESPIGGVRTPLLACPDVFSHRTRDLP